MPKRIENTYPSNTLHVTAESSVPNQEGTALPSDGKPDFEDHIKIKLRNVGEEDRASLNRGQDNCSNEVPRNVILFPAVQFSCPRSGR